MSYERKDAEIASLRAVVQAGIDLITGEAVGSEWKQGCRAFVSDARAVLRGDKPKHVGLIAPVSQPNTEVLQRALGANRRRLSDDEIREMLRPYSLARTGTEWVHDKTGNVYLVLGLAVSVETLKPVVVYAPNRQTFPVWTRDAEDFFAKFTPRG